MGLRDDHRAGPGQVQERRCVMDAADRSHAFETIEMSPAAVHELLARHATERPGRHARRLRDLRLLPAGCTTLRRRSALPATVVAANAEALAVAAGEAQDRPRRRAQARPAGAARPARPPCTCPRPPQRQRRRLILHRRSVVTRRTQCRNAIRSIFSQQGIALARGGKQWTRAGLAQLRAHARPLAECDDDLDLWRGRLHVELDLMAAADAQLKVLDAKLDELAAGDARVALLQTVKGVGPRLAEAVVLHLDDPHRFATADARRQLRGPGPQAARERRR